MENKKYKIVFNAGVSRHLLRKGCPIVDIKADRENPDKSLFIFERTPEFEKAFAEINEGIKSKEQIEIQ